MTHSEIICSSDCEIRCPMKNDGHPCPTIKGFRAGLRALLVSPPQPVGADSPR